MSNEFHIFLPDNPCRKVGLAESQYEWSTTQEHSGCDLLVQKNSCQGWLMVFEEGYTTDLEDYHKVTNILKGRANSINMK